MISLKVTETVGESIIGTAVMGRRYSNVGVGKSVPLLRTGEDAAAFCRCKFIDEEIPMEINLLSNRQIREAFRTGQFQSTYDDNFLDPEGFVAHHPIIGSVPPEVLHNPNMAALDALASSGKTSRAVASMRCGAAPTAMSNVKPSQQFASTQIVPDGAFFSALTNQPVLYGRWLMELASMGLNLGLTLVAPPVAVLNGDLKASARYQHDMNQQASSAISLLNTGTIDVGCLYSFHVSPNALRDNALLRSGLQLFDQAVSVEDNKFFGVHLHFVDIGTITSRGHAYVNAARDVAREVAEIAQRNHIFTWTADVGPVGPVFLDYGHCFASYHPGMTPRRLYNGFGGASKDSLYGRTLGLWQYNLMDIQEVRSKGWTVEDNGKYANVVPVSVRVGGPKKYRLEFGKPNNVAVAERLNDEREKELVVNGNARPGITHIGRSRDVKIAPWA